MAYNRFYFSIVIRIILIIVCGFLFTYFIEQEDKIMASIISFLLVVIQTILLIAYINKTNRNLASFILRMHSKDTAVNYSDDSSIKNFKRLNLSFDHINKEMQQIRIENEQKTNYLNTIVNHTKIGIIAFDEQGKIELFNPEAVNILKCNACSLMNTLEEKSPEFFRAINETNLRGTTSKKINLGSSIQHLAIRKTKINIGNKTMHIVSFQNIQTELDHNEIESWQKLIQVLNHEIMNSLTPITSLSKVIRRYIQKEGEIKKASELNDEILKDIALNTEIIEERSKGLIDFIDVYKDITKNPELKISRFKIAHTLKKTHNFYLKKLNEQHVKLTITAEPNLELQADESLIEQLLINLIKNSLEALTDKENAEIKLVVEPSKDSMLIQIIDNGTGIPQNELDKIFIPFYSTKKQGSGIGLSLARQIMRMHNGSISVESVQGKGSTFTLQF